MILCFTVSCSRPVAVTTARFSGLWSYIKTGTYPRRFFHPEPAAAQATDTDIGPPLSAPHSRTGSWPYHKCERLMGTRETRHILTHAAPTRENKGGTVDAALTHTFSPSHPQPLSLSSSQFVRARPLAWLF